jgi:D-3-phosphoglycerate dehydrogenase / 2-oxoglutarate reductase
VVSIHTPLTQETRGMMDAKAFAAMKKGSIFINAARGGLVKEEALLAALRSGHLFAAGLDVTESEPPQLDNPLLKMDNVIITPHVASGTFSGKRGNFEGALRQALQVLKGERPANLLNPEVWEKLLKRLSRVAKADSTIG